MMSVFSETRTSNTINNFQIATSGSSMMLTFLPAMRLDKRRISVKFQVGHLFSLHVTSWFVNYKHSVYLDAQKKF